MGMKARVLAIFAGVALVAAVAVTAAGGGVKADPGITASSITIGGTFPITGPASLYKTISAAESAYFAYVNDHGGVNGRKINFIVIDDAYDPSKTVPLTQQLVESDKVFAIYGSLGTAPGLATWDYLNSSKVPQVLARHRRLVLGLLPLSKCAARSTRRRSAGSRTIRVRPSMYGKYIAANMPTRRSACSTRTTRSARTTTRVSASVSARRRATSSTPQSYDVATQANRHAADPRR